jgi:5'-nucleotidase
MPALLRRFDRITFLRRTDWRLVVLAALALPQAIQGRQPSPRVPATVTVQLLAVNDFHGNLEPPTGADGQINGIEAGGAEYLATHLAQAVASNPNSIVVGAGDIIGAAPLVSSLFHHEPTIEAMNAMSLAVSSVGNHEFDHGFRELLRMKRGGCHPTDGCQGGHAFSGATFSYLSANVVQTATHKPLFAPTAVRRVGGVPIGFIGETLQGTPRIVAAAGTRGLTFLDEAATANAYAAQLTRQGIHAIVLLIHQGGRQQLTEGSADPNGCAQFSGTIEPLVQKLSPAIHVIISGHTHAFYNCQIGGHLVTSAGSYGRMITRVTLNIDRLTGRIASESATNEIVTRDVARNPAQTQILENYRARAAGAANTVVGSVTRDILRAANTTGESALGDVIADAQLAATSAAVNGGAVVAFMNTGGIRSDLVSSASRPPLRAGEVTYGDLFAVQPFGNVLTVFTMTGEMIKQLLEQQFDNPRPGERSLLQVSHGFTYRYRLTAPPGQHVERDSIRLNGRPIAADERVRAEASDFLVGGGNGYRALGEGVDRIGGVADVDALVEYFKAHSPVAPGGQDRIVRAD